MISGVKVLMDSFSDEIMSRPSYAETYFNFRLNMQTTNVKEADIHLNDRGGEEGSSDGSMSGLESA
jgi:hypothetical protein